MPAHVNTLQHTSTMVNNLSYDNSDLLTKKFNSIAAQLKREEELNIKMKQELAQMKEAIDALRSKNEELTDVEKRAIALHQKIIRLLNILPNHEANQI